MGVNHGGQGTSTLEFGVGTLMQIVPQILCFKILNTRLLALQCMQWCSKKLINPIILTEYSLFPKSTSSTSTKYNFKRKIQHFSGMDTDKTYRSVCTKTRHFKWKIYFFLGRGHSSPPVARGTHSPHLTLRPHQAFWIHPTVRPPEFQPDLRHHCQLLRYRHRILYIKHDLDWSTVQGGGMARHFH